MVTVGSLLNGPMMLFIVSRFHPLQYATLATSWHLWKILWSIITLQKLSGWLFLSINISLQKCSVFVCYPRGGINIAFHFIYLDIFNLNQETVPGLHKRFHPSFICCRLHWNYYCGLIKNKYEMLARLYWFCTGFEICIKLECTEL